MGASQKNQSLNQDNFKNYLVCIHPRLKEAKLVDSSDGPLLQSKTMVQPFLELDPWLYKMERFKQHIYSKYLLLPVKTAIEPRLCSTQQVVVFYYEPFVFSLDHEIYTRTQSHKGFDETQLWYLLYTGVSALTQFQKINTPIGKMCPKNILMNQKGHIRYVNQYSWPGQPSYYVPQTHKQREYMAPEQFVEHSLNKKKSDLFSLGMILLQCLTLMSISDIYSGGAFRSDQFGLHIQYLNPGQQSRYSDLLKQTIKRMLEFKHQKRPLASTIFGQLRGVEAKIVRFQRFT